MPNQYASPPPGKIWVPTPSGNVAMTLAEARTYQAQHRSAITDPTNPNISADIRLELQDPRIQAAIANRETKTIKVNQTSYTIQNGQVTGYSRGSLWKPLLAAGLVAGSGGIAGIYAAGGAGAAGGTAAGLGPATATNLADTAAIASGATVPGSLAALTPAELATVGGSAAAGGGAAAALGPSTPASMAETSAIVGGSTTPPALAANTPSVSSWLGGTGRFLNSPGGATLAGVAGNLIGAGIQSSANTKAAEIAAQTAREALAYEKQRDQYAQGLEANRYAQLTARLQPYMDLGTTSGDRLAQLLGVNPASYTYGLPGGADQPPPAVPPSIPVPNTSTAPTYQTRPGLDTSQQPVGTAVPRPGGVLMRAPDGSLKQVPPDQVPHFQSRGAQPVNG